MELRELPALPPEPIAAAAHFYASIAPTLLGTGDLTLIFPPADHTHRAWRLAAVQSLARLRVPGRVNAMSGGDDAARTAALSFLAQALGVTGQLLLLDDSGAGTVIPSGS